MFADDWRRPPMPAQFALRVAVLGGIGLVVFAVIFLRLWYLEVLSGDRYLAEAENNQIREFTVQAPRGEITDREGRVLVDNRTALELQIDVTEFPRTKKRRAEVIRRLSGPAGMSPEQIRREIRRQTRELPSSPVSLRRDVPYELVYFLRENQSRFPGVSVERVYVRRYPRGTLAAHLFGYVREVDAEELKDPRYDSLDPGDMVGKQGVEYTYDNLLRGVNGASRVQVDASGRPTGGTLSVREARTGNDLQLTIDSDVQATGEAALQSFGNPGGFVAMNVHNGEILGMGSNPSYDPSVFAKPTVPQSVYEQLTSDATSAPITNRAMQGLYPTGSTFKPITAVAALSDDDLNFTPQSVINDPGTFQLGDGQVLRNAGGAAYGTISLRQALQVSSDVFFYTLGRDINEEDPDGGSLQSWAQQLGIGTATGIDVLGEGAGLLPTPGWRNQNYERNTDPDSPGGTDVVVEEGELTDRPWSVGDNVNLAVGQGDLQANPLQMAIAYAAIANGGSVVRPHVGLRAKDPSGRVIQEIDPARRRELPIEPEWRQTIMEGLHDAAMSQGGTSYAVFGGFPVEIAGKTGTAERPPHGDQSWYVALAPYPDPQYVVAVTIEEGGFGAEAAAPAAQKILTELLNVKEKKIKDVSDEGVYE